MNIQVDPTRSDLASAMLNSKIRLPSVVGYGDKIFLPSPPSYVNRSPGSRDTLRGGKIEKREEKAYVVKIGIRLKKPGSAGHSNMTKKVIQETGGSSLKPLISLDPFRTRLYNIFLRVRVHCFFCIVLCVPFF